jgi:hypothetical protein
MNGILAFLAAVLVVGPSIPFFKYQRTAEATNSGGQHYAVVDEILWQHANSDLSDLRLYSGEREIPYAVDTERGGSETEQKECRILQPALVVGNTQFLLDMSGISEYDRVTLKLATKNFVAHARVEGQDDPHGARWAVLGTTTLYDLSEEKLGHNSTLQIPVTTYKYLRVTIDRSVNPADLLSGTAAITRARQVVWQTLNSTAQQTQQGKNTVITFSVPENVPVERVAFEMDPTQPNFRRDIQIQVDTEQPLEAGEISSIHMQRSGQQIDVEQTSLDIRGIHGRTLKAIVHNGDDLPLKITSVHLQQYERRIYFDFLAGTHLMLYYGDKQLTAPVYDYAKLFQKDWGGSQIRLSVEQMNAAYTGRPDERPWSERHPAVLWVAIIAAVLTLGGLAVRSMRTATAA